MSSSLPSGKAILSSGNDMPGSLVCSRTCFPTIDSYDQSSIHVRQKDLNVYKT